MDIKIDVHQLAKLAQILNRMKGRLKAYRQQLPDGYASAETLDINDIQIIFNAEFKKQREVKK